MTDLQLRIIARAVSILVGRGSSVEDALANYPKLTEEERAKIAETIGKE